MTCKSQPEKPCCLTYPYHHRFMQRATTMTTTTTKKEFG
ncbi:hypothetical protein CCACVL1_04527 [Corchorus capsularis]|uniref:Uncharacterized protein n=1 Tax=Corchorus capsularis TaxID=210143 RepID=A0A1R3JRP0_COCAP|nr:hypothetical protein CCACVL1_04527 [Corchorus capsularis]